MSNMAEAPSVFMCVCTVGNKYKDSNKSTEGEGRRKGGGREGRGRLRTFAQLGINTRTALRGEGGKGEGREGGREGRGKGGKGEGREGGREGRGKGGKGEGREGGREGRGKGGKGEGREGGRKGGGREGRGKGGKGEGREGGREGRGKEGRRKGGGREGGKGEAKDVFPHQEGRISSSDGAVRSHKCWLQFRHLLRSRDTNTVVSIHHLPLACREMVSMVTVEQ